MVGPTFKFWNWRGEDWVFGPIVAVSGVCFFWSAGVLIWALFQ